ncbi:MAG TPA: GNAT family N-acetyltransferase [Stellaceae bacterium]|jgi:GNAT superfamily N-acetyltransferase|nr:GNAT family N-acetyltransferase [Stellaceae bacterium]
MSDIVVTPLRPEDRARWAELWRGYLDFYETALPDSIYEHTWARLLAGKTIFGFGARQGGDAAPLIGITHYLFHDHAWSPKQVCYLQDLFVDATGRGSGCGRALIERVAQAARERDCLRLYWTTKEDNATARLLYDRLAKFNGFIRYDYALG